MKTAKIKIPKGYEFDTFDSDTNEIKFKPLPVAKSKLVTTVEDLLKENKLTKASFDKSCKDLEKHEKAYRLLVMLAKTLNNGWKPNWKDSNEVKYYPWFEMESSSGFRFIDGYDIWRSGSDVGSRLAFKSDELAKHAGKYFVDLYKDFMVL